MDYKFQSQHHRPSDTLVPTDTHYVYWGVGALSLSFAAMYKVTQLLVYKQQQQLGSFNLGTVHSSSTVDRPPARPFHN